MSDEKTSLTAALRHLAEQERRTPSEHATPGELTAYHEGALPPQIEARVREHLAHCKLCSDLLLDLAGFADLAPPPGVPELTDAEVEKDWQALRNKLEIGKMEKEELAPVVPFQPVAKAEPKSPRRSPPWFAIAASLLAVAGFSFGLYERREAENLREIRFVPSFNITAERDRGVEREAERFSSQEGGALNLEPDSDETFDKYEADIVADGKVVFSVKSGRSLILQVPGGALKPGEYQIRLFGVVNANRIPAGEFPFRVDAP